MATTRMTAIAAAMIPMYINSVARDDFGYVDASDDPSTVDISWSFLPWESGRRSSILRQVSTNISFEFPCPRSMRSTSFAMLSSEIIISLSCTGLDLWWFSPVSGMLRWASPRGPCHRRRFALRGRPWCYSGVGSPSSPAWISSGVTYTLTCSACWMTIRGTGSSWGGCAASAGMITSTSCGTWRPVGGYLM